jgi:hypothetical protein
MKIDQRILQNERSKREKIDSKKTGNRRIKNSITEFKKYKKRESNFLLFHCLQRRKK